MNVTDGDRERAVRVLVSIPDSNDRVGTMAQALAEERERARAPFDRLLKLCEAVGESNHPHAFAYQALASDIRSAAEETAE